MINFQLTPSSKFSLALLLVLSVIGAQAELNGETDFTSCSSQNTFTCISDNRCIPQDKFCDGVPNCLDGSDEILCSQDQRCLGSSWFMCGNGHCITQSWACDGANDCFDWSDESNCPGVARTAQHCPEGEFKCGNGLCILQSWTCDGEDDCKDGEDEREELCRNVTKEIRTCPEYTCDNGECVPESWVCDGNKDCRDGSDELSCDEVVVPGECYSQQGRFQCKDESFCLSSEKVCDGQDDCGDKSDEGIFCDMTERCDSIPCSHGCIRTEDGPQCYCKEGFEVVGGFNCAKRDECADFGRCSQTCRMSTVGVECTCLAGYQMVNNSCKVMGDEPTLYFSTKTEVRGLRVRTNQFFEVAGDLPHVVGVAYDGVEDRVYWTEVEANKEMIVASHRGSAEKTRVVSNGLVMPEGIAVDQVSRNIYLTDSGRKHVAVCSLDGAACAVLAREGVELPRAIGLHIRSRLVVYSDWGSKPAIVTIGMDGSDRRNIVEEGLVWPNGIAVDQVLERIYFSDAKYDLLETVKLDGTDRRQVLGQIVKHPFSLAVFEDTLYWSDWENKEIQSCNKFNGNDFKVVIKEAGLSPMSISVHHPSMFENVVNPCQNSPCSHLCLPRPHWTQGPGYRCACPNHLTLDTDGVNCKYTQDSQYLVLSTGDKIYRLQPHAIGGQSFELIGTLDGGSISAIATDSLDHNIYVEDKNAREVHKLDIKNNKLSKVLTTAHDLSQLVVDSFAKNIYWINNDQSSIIVQSVKTGARKAIVDKIENPTSLLFIPNHNLLVFSQVILFENEQIGQISTAMTDGSMSTVVDALKGKLKRPIALAYCHIRDCLYIADADIKMILEWNFKSKVSSVFLSGLNEVTDIAVHNQVLYWIQRGSKNLFWAKLEDGVISRLSLQPAMTSPGQNLLKLGTVSNFTSLEDNVGIRCQSTQCSEFCFGLEDDQTSCSCEFGKVLGKDGSSCFKDCPDNVFACGNKCVLQSWVCDGQDDCADGSDEVGCVNKTFNSCQNQFKCLSGQCIPKSFKCDGDFDCADRSDEPSTCPPFTCHESKMKCASSNECILSAWKCDGSNDCVDGSDELDCKGCENGEFQCPRGGLCISQDWVCDGKADCLGGSDEINCTKSECGNEEFTCDNGHCIQMNLICDGENDCGDGSDESESGECYSTIEKECESSEFQCDFQCLPASVRCNGISECSDNADELDCSACPSEAFKCKMDDLCISSKWLCDGKSDCIDGSDEDDCGFTTTPSPHPLCSQDQYQCRTGKCIERDMACDGKVDCEDGSDEHSVNCLMCHLNNGGCPQSCVNTPQGPLCKCHQGFSLQILNNSEVCVDRDECESISTCAQHCENTKGAFKCSCQHQFVPEREGRYCRAKGDSPKLMYATKMSIKGLQMTPHNYRTDLEFISHSAPVGSFDFNLFTGVLYWTSPALGTIRKHSTYGSRSQSIIWLGNVSKPNQLVVDWSTGNVYFSKLGSNHIMVCSDHPEYLNAGHCVDVVTVSAVSFVTHLALDPSEGRMFLAGYQGRSNSFPEGGVWTYGMDGRRINEVDNISGEKVGIPSGLTLDLIMKRVFWADYSNRRISMCGYQGENRQVVKESLQLHPNSLALYESTLFWTSNGLVSSHDLVSGSTTRKEDMILPPAAHSLKFVQETKQPQLANPCAGLGCGGLCYVSHGGVGSCACPTGASSGTPETDNCIGGVKSGAVLVDEAVTDDVSSVAIGSTTSDSRVAGNVEECIWENSRRPNCADVPKSKDGKREFRTNDGCCNNIDNPLFGMSGTPLQRIIDAEYTTNPQTKTMDNPREASRGGELPSARLVSNTIFKAGVKTDRDNTHLLMMIGQFLDHDLVHVPTFNNFGDCCHGAEGFDFPTSIDDPNHCFPIRVPEDDPIWGVGGSKGTRRTCMELKRSIFGPTLDCKAGVREHTSSITHWIDMSMIYGNKESWLRNPKERHLLLVTNPTKNNQRPLLPRCWTMLPEEQKLLDNHKRGEFEICETCKEEGNKDCFFSGDVRTNENPALATMHTIWLREHNRIAMELLSLNSLNHLTKDDIFEEARRIVIAEWQLIVYKEWLPIVIGNNFMNKFEMHPRKSGYSTSYNPSIDPRISNEFAAAAFRFGHTLVFDKIPQRDSSNQEQPPVDLKTVFGDSSGLNEPSFVDKTVRGMVGDVMPAMDADFAEDILHNLFKELLDLPALNIQRARDHGIPGYNKYRGVCKSVASGFGAVSTIGELTKDGRISQDDVNSLKQIYDHVDDIDLFVGGTLEFFSRHDDALVGPTFLCIIGDQFRRLKDGDRFFFENGGDSSTRFTLPQLNEIRNKVSMARILCDNTGIGSIQRQPFLQENPYTNPRYDCSDDEGHIPRLDLTVFVN